MPACTVFAGCDPTCRGYRVPLYPVVPAIFIVAAMFSSAMRLSPIPSGPASPSASSSRVSRSTTSRLRRAKAMKTILPLAAPEQRPPPGVQSSTATPARPPFSRGPMCTATLTLSIVAQSIAACALIIAPLLATDTLPDPRSCDRIHSGRTAGPLPRHRRPGVIAQPRVVARVSMPAPIVTPDGIHAEEPVDRSTTSPRATGRRVIVFGSGDVPIGDPASPSAASSSTRPRRGRDRPPQTSHRCRAGLSANGARGAT